MQTSIPKPFNPYFLVKTDRKKEKDAKEKKGFLYIPPVETFMQYNLPAAEIVAISPKAHEYFPEAKVGHMLLLHHFVQNMNEREAKEENLIHQDELYNYYVVSACEHNGKGVESYGVWDGEKIIPNKDYIFLKISEKSNSDLPEELSLTQNLKQSDSGLFVFEAWEESRKSKEERQKELKKQAEHLSKSGNHKSHIQQAIMEKEIEMGKISADLNKKGYVDFTIAYANPSLSEDFGRNVSSGDKVSIMNIAAQNEITFMDKKYIIAKIKYLGFVYN